MIYRTVPEYTVQLSSFVYKKYVKPPKQTTFVVSTCELRHTDRSPLSSSQGHAGGLVQRLEGFLSRLLLNSPVSVLSPLHSPSLSVLSETLSGLLSIAPGTPSRRCCRLRPVELPSMGRDLGNYLSSLSGILATPRWYGGVGVGVGVGGVRLGCCTVPSRRHSRQARPRPSFPAARSTLPRRTPAGTAFRCSPRSFAPRDPETRPRYLPP